MKYLALFLLALLVGCESMPVKISDDIRLGDSSKRLLALFGSPTFNLPSIKTKNARGWYYVQGDQICGFTVKDEEVIRVTTCLPFTPEVQQFINRIAETEILPEYR